MVDSGRAEPTDHGTCEKERVFLDSSVLLTATCCRGSDSAKLLDLCRDGQVVGITSDKILEECLRKLDSKPDLRSRFDELVGYLEIIAVSSQDAEKYGMIADPDDRHVLAGAEIASGKFLVTLDWKHFLSSSAKKRLADYPIRRVFPGVLTSPFRERQLPQISVGVATGTFSIGVEPLWTTDVVRNAGHPFFLLDLPGVFGIWYDPERFYLKTRVEVYKKPQTLVFPRYIGQGDAFLCIVAWDRVRGFIFMIDGKQKKIPRPWDRLPLFGTRLWVGSDRNGENQINGLLVFHGWPRALNEKEIWRVFQGGYVTLPERPASL